MSILWNRVVTDNGLSNGQNIQQVQPYKVESLVYKIFLYKLKWQFKFYDKLVSYKLRYDKFTFQYLNYHVTIYILITNVINIYTNCHIIL